MASPTFGQAPSALPIDPRLRTELVSAREAVWRAYFQGDSATLVHLLPERMTAMGRDRTDVIRDAMTYARGGGKYVSMEFTQEEFFVNGSTAILWSHYLAHLANSAGEPDEIKGRAIELFTRVHGRWINPYWHLDAEP